MKKINFVFLYFDRNTFFPEGKFNMFILFNFILQKTLGENV